MILVGHICSKILDAIMFLFFYYYLLLWSIKNGCDCWYSEIHNGDERIKADAKRIGQYPDGQFPTDSKEFAKRILYTVFMGTENRYNSLSYGSSNVLLLCATY